MTRTATSSTAARPTGSMSARQSGKQFLVGRRLRRLSRSELQNGQPFPSVSAIPEPATNADGSIDIVFGPDEPKRKGNWIRTVPGKGWFPIFRFYGPAGSVFRQDLEAGRYCNWLNNEKVHTPTTAKQSLILRVANTALWLLREAIQVPSKYA